MATALGQGEAVGTGSAPRVADGVCIYAVGDVHGRADLLIRMQDRIAAHAATLPPGVRAEMVFLGDYVDRGAHSKEVIELLTAPPPPGLNRLCLRGNHEDMMDRFLGDPDSGLVWLANGGVETLESYGLYPNDLTPDGLQALSRALMRILPSPHRTFLAGLERLHASGDYLFCHAGIDPRLPLAKQNPDSLLWIREPFLSEGGVPGKVVVHGHTIAPEPDIRPHRIGIDTGAFLSGCLTCAVLFEDQRAFLTATV